MKQTIYAALTALLLAPVLPVAAYAEHHEDHAEEDRVIHYEAQRPETIQKALTILDEKSAVISDVLDRDSLKDAHLEAIHKASYWLEAATDRLRENQNDEQEVAIDALDEAVQALHYASENHEEEKTRTWFVAMAKAIKEVKHVF